LQVTANCISKCFNKAGFKDELLRLSIPPDEAEDEEPVREFRNLFENMISVLHVPEASLDDYVNVDGQIIVTSDPSDADIAQEVQGQDSSLTEPDDDDENDDDFDPIPPPPPSSADALHSIEILQKYIQNVEDVPDEIFGNLNKIGNFITTSASKKSKQRNITDFFTRQ